MASRIIMLPSTAASLMPAPMRCAIKKTIVSRSSSRGTSMFGVARPMATGGAVGWRGRSQYQWVHASAMSISTGSFSPLNSSSHQSFNNMPSFSTAAAAMPQPEEIQEPAEAAATKKQPQRAKRKPMRKRDPLVITPTAAARIQFLINQHNQSGGDSEGNHAVGIRLGTKKRGCNGLSYTLNYAYENHLDNHGRDEAMTISLGAPDMAGEGLKVFVEPMALMNVIGTTMDFVDDEMSSEFTFTNPNSKGECGCGESFNV